MVDDSFYKVFKKIPDVEIDEKKEQIDVLKLMINDYLREGKEEEANDLILKLIPLLYEEEEYSDI